MIIIMDNPRTEVCRSRLDLQTSTLDQGNAYKFEIFHMMTLSKVQEFVSELEFEILFSNSVCKLP